MNVNKQELVESIKQRSLTALKHKRELSDIITSDSLTTSNINHVWKEDYPGGQKVIKGILQGIDLGYGGDEQEGYGAGPTRSIASASYALRSTHTLHDVKLTRRFFNKLNDAYLFLIEHFADDVSKEDPKVKLKEGLSKYVAINNHAAEIAVASIDVDNKGTHVEFKLSHIRKQKQSYVGDVSFHFVRLFGDGSAFFPSQRTFSEEASKLYHSLTTRDLYHPSSEEAKPIAIIFRHKLESTRDSFSEKANAYFTRIPNLSQKPVKVSTHNTLTVYNR